MFTKGITELETKGVYVAALFKNQHYLSKGVSGDPFDNQFEDKELGNVGMVKSRTEDNKLFKIFS